MTVPRDRLAALLGSGLNGLDYVELVPGTVPPRLRVHFLTNVPLAGPVTAALDGGDRIAVVALGPIAAGDWSADAEGRPMLTLRPRTEGDFSTYTLTITSAILDAKFAAAPVSFKAFCPS